MDGRALQEEAIGLHRRGDFGRAEALYRQLLAAMPANVEARFMFAQLCFQQGRANEAIGVLDEALACAPRFVEALVLKGVALHGWSLCGRVGQL